MFRGQPANFCHLPAAASILELEGIHIPQYSVGGLRGVIPVDGWEGMQLLVSQDLGFWVGVEQEAVNCA